MIKVLTTVGINPRHSQTSPLNALTQSDLETLFRSSRLRGKCDALLVVDLSASLASGAHWDVDADGMYCSNDVPIQPAYLHSAYTDKHGPTYPNMGRGYCTWASSRIFYVIKVYDFTPDDAEMISIPIEANTSCGMTCCSKATILLSKKKNACRLPVQGSFDLLWAHWVRKAQRKASRHWLVLRGLIGGSWMWRIF